jgi:nitroreductase
MDATAFASLSRVIHGRRTHKAYTGAAVPRQLLEQALELARWAPTHRMTEPWRFYVLEQPAIARLAAFLRLDPAFAPSTEKPNEKATAKLAKLLERLPNAGALIQATWVRAGEPAIDLEEHAAAAAAVENLLLGLSALGLGGYWSTSAPLVHPATLRWCGVDLEREASLGCVWVGVPAAQPPTPPRSPLEERVRWLDRA